MLKEDEIKIVIREQVDDFTAIYFSADPESNILKVSESVEEIEKALNENVVWKPVEI